MNLGRIKAKADRAFYYYGRAMQIVSGYGILKLLGLSWWQLLAVAVLSIPLVVLLVYLDIRYIFPQEQEYIWAQNPTVTKIIERGLK